MIETLKSAHLKILKLLNLIDWAPAFATRIALGHVFFFAGWGKLGNLDRVTGFFESIGIPMASIQAPFVSGLEFIGGLCLLLGLGTRLFSALLAFTMVVAIYTTQLSDFEGLGDLFGNSEFLYILLFFFLMVKGAGKVSFDSFLSKKMNF